MYKCVKLQVICSKNYPQELIPFVEQAAKKSAIEGSLVVKAPQLIEILAAGTKQSVDAFIEQVESSVGQYSDVELEIEPAFKERDYRGVFRVIR